MSFLNTDSAISNDPNSDQWWHHSLEFYLLLGIIILLLFLSMILLLCWWCQVRSQRPPKRRTEQRAKEPSEKKPTQTKSRSLPTLPSSPGETQSISSASKFDLSVEVVDSTVSTHYKGNRFRTMGRNQEDEEDDMWSFSVVR
jgi:hypothetical protein